MGTLTPKLLIRCFARSYCLNAGYNPHGLQGTGFVYAINPALEAFYPDQEELCRARLRYLSHFNTHPFWSPLLLGVFIRVESEIAGKHLPASMLDNIKPTMCNALSAIGDSIFQGSLTPAWALLCGCMAVSGLPLAAFFFTLGLFILIHILRLAGFVTGLKKGMGVLPLLRRYRIADWSWKIKYFNGMLLALFIFLSMPKADVLWFGAAGLFFLVVGGLTAWPRLPRMAVILVLLIYYSAFLATL